MRERLTLLALLLLGTTTASSWAAMMQISVDNFDFEADQTTGPGSTTVTGWSASKGSGIYLPAANDANPYSSAVDNARGNVAYSGSATGVIAQETDETFNPFRPYDLSVLVGYRNDSFTVFGGYAIRLAAGGETIVERRQDVRNTSGFVKGQFKEVVVRYLPDLEALPTAAGKLTIEFNAFASQTNFDDVRLFAGDPLALPEAVPEPLAAGGLVGLAAIALRRRRS